MTSEYKNEKISEDKSESIRLAKKLASQIPCSRSEAVKYIEGGFVKVDGKVVEEPGFRVRLEQQIELMPEAKHAELESVTILFHKPAGVNVESNPDAIMRLITSENHAQDDRSGINFIKKHLKEIEVLDPLGLQSSGLMVLSQDWRITRKLKTDAATIEQEYIVETAGEIIPEGLQQLNKGIPQDGKLLQVKVSWQSENRLRFAFKGVRREQLARMCEQVDLKVLSMKRIRIGRVPLSSLQAGQWRYLLGYEKF